MSMTGLCQGRSMQRRPDSWWKQHFTGIGDEQLSQAAVRAVYGGQLTGGVTMLEKYAACAYAHFLSYGLHLKERKIYQVQRRILA